MDWLLLSTFIHIFPEAICDDTLLNLQSICVIGLGRQRNHLQYQPPPWWWRRLRRLSLPRRIVHNKYCLSNASKSINRRHLQKTKAPIRDTFEIEKLSWWQDTKKKCRGMKTKLVFIHIVHLNCHMQIIIPRWMAVFLSLLPLINDNNETRFIRILWATTAAKEEVKLHFYMTVVSSSTWFPYYNELNLKLCLMC